MAPKVSALVAPRAPYGVTGSLDAFAGGFTIGEDGGHAGWPRPARRPMRGPHIPSRPRSSLWDEAGIFK